MYPHKRTVYQMLANFILIPATLMVLVYQAGFALLQTGHFVLALFQFCFTLLVIAYWLAPFYPSLKARATKMNLALVIGCVFWGAYIWVTSLVPALHIYYPNLN